jgi:hypothetical protein
LVQQLINLEKGMGIQYLIVKAGQGDHFYPASPDCPQVNTTFINMAHAAGIKVYGFHYVYGGAYDPFYKENTDVGTEVTIAQQILATGADGLVIDAELEYEDGQASRYRVPGPGSLPSAALAADSYCSGILNKYPSATLAYSPIWKPSDHPGFPYSTFNKYSAAAMPQAYSSAYATAGETWLNNVPPAQMISELDAAWTSAQNIWKSQGKAVIPIVPVAWAASPTTGQEITDFVNALKNDTAPATSGGYQGVSFYDADSNTVDIRTAISSATIGPASGGNVPPVIDQQPLGQLAATGQLVVFTADAVGTPTPVIQWQQSIDQGATFQNILGATSNTLSFTAALAQQGYQYHAIFSNSAGSITSQAAALTVIPPSNFTTTVGVSSPQTSTAGQSVTFTATVTSNGGTPTGAVAFYDSAVVLATKALSGGSGTFSTTSLSVGSHLIAAIYSGDSNFATSTSPSFTQTVNPSPALQVDQTTALIAAGNQGGPFSPSSFQYQLQATVGSVGYSISGVPSWLTASPTSGSVSTSPVTITFTINSSANNLLSGIYNGTITFTDTTNNNTVQQVAATLDVNALSALSVSVAGNGTVTSSPSGINCGSMCIASFTSGTQVTLTATASAGSTFSGWSGACIGTGGCSITMNAAASVSASFSTSSTPPAPAPRTFVSAAGSDSNNCTNVATPCRHLAAAYAATAANGEIYVLDPANYGSLTIARAVSIEGHGWASIAPVAGQAAITINANTGDKINIIGVVLDGTALASTTGIKFNSGGSLNIRDSVIRNFGSDGIAFASTSSSPSQLSVSNTLVSDNSANGINIAPSGSGAVTGALDHVDMDNNGANGLVASTAAATVNVTFSASLSANNGAGISASSVSAAPVNIMVRDSTIANNASNGLVATSTGATIRVTQSTISGNTVGWLNSSGGVVTSYADNNIDRNGTANTEPPSPLSYR